MQHVCIARCDMRICALNSEHMLYCILSGCHIATRRCLPLFRISYTIVLAYFLLLFVDVVMLLSGGCLHIFFFLGSPEAEQMPVDLPLVKNRNLFVSLLLLLLLLLCRMYVDLEDEKACACVSMCCRRRRVFQNFFLSVLVSNFVFCSGNQRGC